MIREWRLVELYPEYTNRELFQKLKSLNVEYSSVMEKFVNAKLSDQEAAQLNEMAFVHEPRKQQLI